MTRTKAATVCPTHGCPNSQPCATHTRKPWANSTRAKRLPPQWDKTRRRIFKRDGHTCQACLGIRCGNLHLEVDHIVNNDDHDDRNLRTIGHTPCHVEKIQAESRAARSQGWG